MFDIREDLLRRYKSEKKTLVNPQDLLDCLFPIQLQSLAWGERFKAVYCTRRAGKTVSRVVRQVHSMVKYHGSKCIYGALTRDSAVGISWDIFLDFLDTHKIRYKTNLKDMRIILPDYGNSSTQFFGLDSSEKAARKILGQGLRDVVIDECGSITQNMHRICFMFIRPALIDLAPFSWLDVIGTPEDIPNTYFSKVCKGEERSFDWKIYNWSAFDNPHIAEQWQEEIESIPDEFKETFEYKCHYLGQFVTNTDNLILKFSEKNYFYTDTIKYNDYVCVIGVDLGFNDATAITVGLFDAEKSNHLIIPMSEKRRELDIEEALIWVTEVSKRFNAVRVVIDGANKQGVEYMRKRFPIPMEATDKKDKGTFFRLLQADITMLRVLIDPVGCADLLEESRTAIFDEKKKALGIYIEDLRCAVDAIDSFLYLHRYCYHYLFSPKEKKPKFDSTDYWDDYWEKRANKTDDFENIIYGNFS